MIKSNEKYIVTCKDGFKIYNKTTLALIKRIPMENIKLFELSRDFIIFADNMGVFLFNIQKEDIKMEFQNGSSKITVLFVKDSFVYVGHENGLINVYNFNEHMTKFLKNIKHPGPITSLVSDNLKIFVSDLRNKITVYPENISYDFKEPRMFFKKYAMTLTENRLYAHTKDSNGFLFEFPFTTENIQFGPSGGTIFSYFNGFVNITDMLGNQLGKIMASDYTVIANKERCFIVEEVGDQLKSHETFVRDLEMPDFNFPKIEIFERKISAEEYEEKHLYVDDGNKKNKPQIRENKKNVRKTFISDSSSNYDDEGHHEAPSNQNLPNDNYNEDVPKQSAMPFIDPILTVKNPSSFENTEGRLLYYSSQGFMISVESPLTSQIFIKFHDRTFEGYEIKDPLKCKLGSFCDNNYVISDGNSVNFSGRWTKEIKCNLLGLTSQFIFIFSPGNLTLFDYSGTVKDIFYVKDAYSFCAGEDSLAVFCKDFLMLMKDGESTSYIPASGIEFGCFDSSDLYVKIGTKLFICYKSMFKFVCDLNERPLTVYGDNVIILAENSLLPRPVVRFYPVRSEVINEVKFDFSASSRYNPSMN